MYWVFLIYGIGFSVHIPSGVYLDFVYVCSCISRGNKRLKICSNSDWYLYNIYTCVYVCICVCLWNGSQQFRIGWVVSVLLVCLVCFWCWWFSKWWHAHVSLLYNLLYMNYIYTIYSWFRKYTIFLDRKRNNRTRHNKHALFSLSLLIILVLTVFECRGLLCARVHVVTHAHSHTTKFFGLMDITGGVLVVVVVVVVLWWY